MGLFKKCCGCGKKERPGNSLQFSETSPLSGFD